MNKDKMKAKALSNLDKLKAAGKERKAAFNKGYKTGTKAIAKSDSITQSTGIATGAVVGLCAHVVHEAVSFLPSVSRA
jgi:hypothetical protein